MGLALPAAAESPQPKPIVLYFTYPCTFAYTDGAPYETRIMDWQCDYIHASVYGGNRTFNSMPTLASQRAFLEQIIPIADAAHNKYIASVSEILKNSDPAQISDALTPPQRLEGLGKFEE